MTTKRFWISWNQPGDDLGPQSWPSPEWWCTGWGVDYATVCAIVDADGEDAAKEIVKKQWSPREWRFVDEKNADWRPPADRFPPRATFTTTTGGEQ